MKLRTTAVARTLAAAAAVAGAVTLPALAQAGSAAPAGNTSPVAAATTVNLPLQTSSPALAACFPYASANAAVTLTTNTLGKDTFKITASGLRPNTGFTVFLLEKAGAPFGAAEYIGDFTTNQYGYATNTYQLIVEEAFAFNNSTGVRKNLNSVGFWFADPRDDDACLGAGSPVTQFDGDASAGVQMMNSGTHLLP